MVYHRPLLGHLVGVVQKLLSRWFLDPKSTITCSCPMGRWARGSMKNKAFSFKPAHRVAAMNSSARRRTSGGTFKKKHPPSTCNPSSIVERVICFRKTLLLHHLEEKKHVSVHRSSRTNLIKVSIRHAGWWKKNRAPVEPVEIMKNVVLLPTFHVERVKPESNTWPYDSSTQPCSTRRPSAVELSLLPHAGHDSQPDCCEL